MHERTYSHVADEKCNNEKSKYYSVGFGYLGHHDRTEDGEFRNRQRDTQEGPFGSRQLVRLNLRDV